MKVSAMKLIIEQAKERKAKVSLVPVGDAIDKASPTPVNCKSPKMATKNRAMMSMGKPKDGFDNAQVGGVSPLSLLLT